VAGVVESAAAGRADADFDSTVGFRTEFGQGST
jgi:hypothetical protein